MIFGAKPEEFNQKFDVVSCFIEYEDKMLLLLRQDIKVQGNTWTVPAGKINKSESLKDALI